MGQGKMGSDWMLNSGTLSSNQVTIVNEISCTCVCSMESWNIEEVCEFLMKYEFDEEVVQIFRVNKISGSVLVLLSDTDMKELGLTALGDRKRLQFLLKKTPTKLSGQFLNEEEAPGSASTAIATTETVRLSAMTLAIYILCI